jgi:hypothetical protein
MRVIGEQLIATKKQRRLLLKVGGHAIIGGHLQEIPSTYSNSLVGIWTGDEITFGLQPYTL